MGLNTGNIDAKANALDALWKKRDLLQEERDGLLRKIAIHEPYPGQPDIETVLSEMETGLPDWFEDSSSRMIANQRKQESLPEELAVAEKALADVIQQLKNAGAHLGENELLHQLEREQMENPIHVKEDNTESPLQLRRKMCAILGKFGKKCPFNLEVQAA